MSFQTAPLKLVPPGLIVDHHEIGADGITVHARGASGVELLSLVRPAVVLRS